VCEWNSSVRDHKSIGFSAASYGFSLTPHQAGRLMPGSSMAMSGRRMGCLCDRRHYSPTPMLEMPHVDGA